jgi:hypothetical protein
VARIIQPRNDVKSINSECQKATAVLWEEKLEGWSVEESQVVNRWIAGREAQQKLRLATKRFGAASAWTEAAIGAITKPDRLERRIERVSEAAAWPDLLATA